MASFCYKLVGPSICSGNTLLRMSTMFPERFKGGGKTHFPVSVAPYHRLRSRQRRRRKGAKSQHSSFYFMTAGAYNQLPHVPAAMFGWAVPSICEPNRAFFPSAAFTMYFVTELRKANNTIIIIKWFESLSSLRNSTTAALEK